MKENTFVVEVKSALVTFNSLEMSRSHWAESKSKCKSNPAKSVKNTIRDTWDCCKIFCANNSIFAVLTLQCFSTKSTANQIMMIKLFFFCNKSLNSQFSLWNVNLLNIVAIQIQPVSYKRFFRCNNCFLLLVYTIHLSLSTDLVDTSPIGTIYMKHALCRHM